MMHQAKYGEYSRRVKLSVKNIGFAGAAHRPALKATSNQKRLPRVKASFLLLLSKLPKMPEDA